METEIHRILQDIHKLLRHSYCSNIKRTKFGIDIKFIRVVKSKTKHNEIGKNIMILNAHVKNERCNLILIRKN